MAAGRLSVDIFLSEQLSGHLNAILKIIAFCTIVLCSNSIGHGRLKNLNNNNDNAAT
jgi:hypothetical protein